MRRAVPALFAFFSAALAALSGAAPAAPSHRHVDVLYRFSGGADGGFPYGPLVEASAGHLIGVTLYGGDSNLGVVFALSPAQSGQWQEAVLHRFGGADGAYPNPGL